MALTRKFLSALGIEDDKVDQIIEAHSQTVNGLKEQIDTYKVDAEKLPHVQKELDEVKSSLEHQEEDPYKEMYETLKNEFDSFKVEVETKTTKTNKEHAYRNLLREAGVSDKRIESILKVSNVDSVELDSEGKVTNVDALVTDIKSEWADFITTTKVEGAKTETPPSSTGGNEFEKLSLAEKMAYANQHPQEEAVQSWLNKKE